MIPFFSLQERNRIFELDINSAIQEVLESGFFIGGPFLTRFEKLYAQYCGVDHFVGTGNGLDAISLTLEAMNLESGSEVIVPGFTFIATWLAVSQLGLTIVPVDVRLDTATIDFDAIEAAITNRTRVVLVVELYGRPSLTIEQISNLQERGIVVVADGAQAHGAKIGSKPISLLYDAVTYSFYPTKNLGGLGDGGGVATRDEKLAAKIRTLSNYGSSGGKYEYLLRGRNSRLDPIQANILTRFLPHLDDWNTSRREIASRYRSLLRVPGECQIGFHEELSTSVWHHYVIMVDNRSNILKAANEVNISLDVHYPITPLGSKVFDGYCSLDQSKSIPNSLFLAERVVSLPMYPQLTYDSQEKIVDFLNSYTK